jgi:branched-chain amino acid transport system permease protein
MSQTTLSWITGIVGALLLIAAPAVLPEYYMHIAITAYFYAILASSWTLLAGYAGQFSFGHMAFMAIGAYSTGLLGKFIRLTSAPTHTCAEYPLGNFWLVFINPTGVTSSSINCLEIAKENMPLGTLIITPPVWLGLVLAILMGALFGFLVGALILRLRSTYLALFTIGFSEIVRAALNAEINITEGQSGLELVHLFPNGILWFSSTDKIPPYYVMLTLFLLSMALMSWLASSRFGLFIRAIREDEEAAAALGVNIVRYKILVFVITSSLAAAAGAVQAHYIGIITPNILIILQMSLVISMAVIGGLESLVGAAIGAIIIQFALELLRSSFTIGPIEVDMSVWRLVFFGLLLMITLRFQRNGLIAPIIDRFTRGDVAAETVAKRKAAADA